MQLDLDGVESSDLKNALDLYLRSLREELVHTDDRSYRRSIREKLERLENIAERLARGSATVSP